MTLAVDEFIRRFLLHVCRAASTASGTTACSPAAPARPASLAPANSWTLPAPADDDTLPTNRIDFRPHAHAAADA
jgi:hypothetical protein